MDRPEDIERTRSPAAVYVALTNNSNRAPRPVDEANPRPTNKQGHVLELARP